MDAHSGQHHRPDGDNYQRWKYDTTVMLQTRDLLRIASGDEKLPDPLSTKDKKDGSKVKQYQDGVAAWTIKDARAREILVRSLDERHHDMIRSCATALGILKTLRTLYEQQSATNLYQVQSQYHDLQWTRDMNALEFISQNKEWRTRWNSWARRSPSQ